ncbi:pentatricopeptide repeat-containing protein [Tripterygium wilfordii]|uniref:Pentatricopeptide repeat-containing protein n=1 Tax=Tripterygium wilfordii TaxID=458696 RepID=A0A7J7DBU2_TRIWF|nr:pentatricopeptide repeat-containing protein [Tripterygium wilfordii]
MSLTLGTQVHGHVMKLGFAEDIFSQNNLIKMYKKFGVLDDGFKLFDEMPYRNLVSWTLIISGAIQLGHFEVGVEMFMEMTRTGLVPNEFAFGSVMKACTSMGASDFGSCVHCFALKIGLEINPFVGCSILNFYAKLGDIVAGERIFEGLNYVDIGCWNSMIGGYAQCGYGLEAVNIVSSMRWDRITMDKFTFVNVLQGCTDLGDMDIGKQIHGLILRSEMEFDTSVMNALMHMYFENGGRNSAWKVFRRMLNKDVVSWNTVFGGACQYEDSGEVARLYHEFIGTGMRPNYVTFSGLFRRCAQLCDLNLGLQFFCHALCFGFFNEYTVACSLINMFAQCGTMEMACLVFESGLLTDITPWNELISGHNLNYHEIEALQIFCKLWELGVEANEFTFCSILESCSRSEDWQMCRQIHAAIIKSGFVYQGYVCNSLVECYIKLGLLDESFKLFCCNEKLDIACWGMMVSALVHQGYSCEAISRINRILILLEKNFLTSIVQQKMKVFSYCFVLLQPAKYQPPDLVFQVLNSGYKLGRGQQLFCI